MSGWSDSARSARPTQSSKSIQLRDAHALARRPRPLAAMSSSSVRVRVSPSRSARSSVSALLSEISIDFAEHRDALFLARDPEIAMQSGRIRMRAQDRQPERMERVDRDLCRALCRATPCSRSRISPAARRVKVTARQFLRRDAAFVDQIGDAMRQRAGLAGAGAGEDEQRALDDLSRAALVGVEQREDAGRQLDLSSPRRRGPVHPGMTGGRISAWGPALGLRPRPGRQPVASWGSPPRHRRLEQHPAEALQLPILEQLDHAVLAVIAGIADHLAGAQARDRLGQHRGLGARDVLDRHLAEDRQLRPERADHAVVHPLDRLRSDAARGDLREHLRQRHQVRHRAGGRGRRHDRAAIRQHLDAMLDADRDLLAAHRAAAAVRERFLRGEPHVALAVAVEVILAFLGEELDRAGIALAGLERAAQREVIHVAIERRRLAAELAGRMRVGVRGQTIAIEERHAPVHRRIGRQPGLDREDVRRQIAVAVRDGVEARL